MSGGDKGRKEAEFMMADMERTRQNAMFNNI